MSFSKVDSRYDGPQLEENILAFWREQDVFKRSLEQTQGQPLFTFNEGAHGKRPAGYSPRSGAKL